MGQLFQSVDEVKQEVAFLKKSSAKNFCKLSQFCWNMGGAKKQKFFGSFFQKRTHSFLTADKEISR
jgi:hypothetical protein